MSTLVVDTLTGKSTATTLTIGSTPVVSASANSLTIRGEGSNQTSVQQGLCKAWINKSASGTTINDSFNVSSLDDDGTGDFGVHYATDFASTNYCWSSGNDDGSTTTAGMMTDSTNGGYAAGSTEFETYFVNSGSNRTMHDLYSFVSVVGDLA